MGGPGVDAPAALAPHLGDVGAVHHRKAQPEAALHLPLPLQHHRGRCDHHHSVDLLAQQQLAQDEPGLDRLAQAHVIGDEQTHPQHPQRLAQRFELVGLPIAGDAIPAEGVQGTAEHLRLIKAPLTHGVPRGLTQHPGIHLPLPEHLKPLTVGVLVEARHPHQPVPLGVLGGLHLLHQPAVAAAEDHTALTGDNFRELDLMVSPPAAAGLTCGAGAAAASRR